MDTEKVEKARNGNVDEIGNLLMENMKSMYRVAFSILKTEEEISDAISNTTVIVFEKIHTLKNAEFFKTWLIRILINECNDIHRKRKKNPISYDENECENYIKSEEETFENMGFDVLIRDLKEDEKMILTLYYCSGYSTKDIGKILKMKESTVRSKMFRAKEKLKNQYEGGYYE